MEDKNYHTHNTEKENSLLKANLAVLTLSFQNIFLSQFMEK